MDSRIRSGLYVHWSEEDQGWIATCPDYPSISWFHKTSPALALEGLRDLMEEEGLE